MTKTKVYEVEDIVVSQEQQRITATGTVNTAGWKEAELVLRPSESGVVEFDFVAQPPDGPVADVIMSIEAMYSPLPNQGNFMRVRIYASNNFKEVVFE